MTTLSAWILILSITLADGKVTTTLQAYGNQPDCAEAAIEAVADNMASAARISVSCKPQNETTQADLIPTDLTPGDDTQGHSGQPATSEEQATPVLPAPSPGQPTNDRNL